MKLGEILVSTNPNSRGSINNSNSYSRMHNKFTKKKN